MEEPKETPIREVHRREAGSGRVSYGDPVVLRESSQSRVVVVPFFVPRSGGTDLAAKIVTYKKAPPPDDWHQVQEKSVSLDEATARKLLRALKEHLAVSEQDEDGDYLVVRVDQGTADFGDLDPAAVASAITKVLSKREIAEHLAETELSDELVLAFRGAIRLREMRSAVASLRQHLESGETDERVYQRWCEEHSWAFGNAYVLADDVRDISTGDRIDLLMPSVISGYRDIVELKRPDFDVLVWDSSHKNFYFSAEVSKAVGQVHRYLDVLHESAEHGLRDHPEVVAYHPRAIIVLGRSAGWTDEKMKALHGLNSRLNGVVVMTYDQLLAQGERLVEMLSHEQTELFDRDIEDHPVWDGGDDLPFGSGSSPFEEDDNLPF